MHVRIVNIIGTDDGPTAAEIAEYARLESEQERSAAAERLRRKTGIETEDGTL